MLNIPSWAVPWVSTNCDAAVTPHADYWLADAGLKMLYTELRVGTTHTAKLLQVSCPTCGLGHPLLQNSDACLAFQQAIGPVEEQAAWRNLKLAVEAQQQ
jgi:hypothetical protein